MIFPYIIENVFWGRIVKYQMLSIKTLSINSWKDHARWLISKLNSAWHAIKHMCNMTCECERYINPVLATLKTLVFYQCIIHFVIWLYDLIKSKYTNRLQ